MDVLNKNFFKDLQGYGRLYVKDDFCKDFQGYERTFLRQFFQRPAIDRKPFKYVSQTEEL